MDIKELVKQAIKASENSYSPYSGYQVGAALLCKNGKVYTGCNIESATYSPTNCAERTAFFKAVSEGERDFLMIAVVGGAKDKERDTYFYPCGVCRQVMTEFCDYETFKVIVAKSVDDVKVFTLKELMPNIIKPDKI